LKKKVRSGEGISRAFETFPKKLFGGEGTSKKGKKERKKEAKTLTALTKGKSH